MDRTASLRISAALLTASSLLLPVCAQAQTPPGDTPAPASTARPTGLPQGVDWTFNFDATWGTFGFANSLFINPKEGVDEHLGDQWLEGSAKPALSGRYTLANSSEFSGKVSAVGEVTYGEAPELVGSDFSSFRVEDLSMTWRSGKTLESLGDNAVEFTVGRTQYKLGHGFLLYDGAAEGGSRGGFWTNARKAFEFAGIGSFKPGRHKMEGFYLDRDDLPENQTGTRLWGTNYEFTLDEHSTVGATYLKVFADPDVKPGRDGLNVFNVRAYVTPIRAVPDLSLESEYASERNGDALHSNAWTLQGSYALAKTAWKPKFTYRYAFFQGDNPDTPRNESFDPLLLGFYDWGYWWQGEIAGEYFLSNSNLKSNLIRAHVTPTDAVSGGLMLYNFSLDQPQALGPAVTSKDVALEIDAYVDWKLNKNITFSFVTAFADPGKAVQQFADRTKNFVYGMWFVSYAY